MLSTRICRLNTIFTNWNSASSEWRVDPETFVRGGQTLRGWGLFCFLFDEWREDTNITLSGPSWCFAGVPMMAQQ